MPKQQDQWPVEWLPLDRLESDVRIQRPLNMNWCEKRKDELDLDLIGTLVVWKDGRRYIVIDGQHRAQLMRLAGFGEYRVPCKVLSGRTLAEASKAFNGLNDHRRVDYVTLFKNRVNFGDPVAVAITTIAKELGLVVAMGNAPNHVQAAKALCRIYTHGGGEHARAVRLSLATAKQAWNLSADSFHQAIVEGLGLVFIRYGATVDADDLAAKLAKNGTPAKLIGQGRGRRESLGGSLPHGVAGVCVMLYNKGRRVGKVEDWR